MFDIKILGYSFYHEYNDKTYPIVKIEAKYEDNFLCFPIMFERVYDAYALVYNRLDGTLDDMIKNFVDELWKEFHKGIPKAYEIELYISLPVGLNMLIKEHIRNEIEKRLAIKRDEDEICRALSNSRYGTISHDMRHMYPVPIIPEEVRNELVNKTFLVLGRGSGKWEAQMKMLENYIKTGRVEFVPNRDIRTLTKQEVEDMMNRETVKNFVKERNTLQISDVIFNDPATIVFWRDGSKTVVKAQNEPYDPEKGLAMAIAKKTYGNKHDYYNTIKHWLKKYEPSVKVNSIKEALEYLKSKEDNKNE